MFGAREKDESTILLSLPVIHNLKKGEGRRVEDLLGLNVFVDLSVAQGGHLFCRVRVFILPSVVRLFLCKRGKIC